MLKRIKGFLLFKLALISFLWVPLHVSSAPKRDSEVWQIIYEPDPDPNAQSHARFKYTLNGATFSFGLHNLFHSAYVVMPYAYVFDNQSYLYVFNLCTGINEDIVSSEKNQHVSNGKISLLRGDYVIAPISHLRSGPCESKKYNRVIVFNKETKAILKIIPAPNYSNIRAGEKKVFIYGYTFPHDMHFWIKCFDLESMDIDTNLEKNLVLPRSTDQVYLFVGNEQPWIITSAKGYTDIIQPFPKPGSKAIQFSFNASYQDYSLEFLHSSGNMALHVEGGVLYAVMAKKIDYSDFLLLGVYSLETGKELRSFKFPYSHNLFSFDSKPPIPKDSMLFPLYPTVSHVKKLIKDKKLDQYGLLCKSAFANQNSGQQRSMMTKEDAEFYALLSKTASHCQDLIYRCLPAVCVLDALSKTKDNKFKTSTEGQVLYPLLVTQLCRHLWFGQNAKAHAMVGLFLDLEDPDLLEVYAALRPAREMSFIKEKVGSLFTKAR